MFPSLFNIQPDHTKEKQWETLGEMSISSFLVRDSWWLLYTQPKMSEGNTAYLFYLICFTEFETCTID